MGHGIVAVFAGLTAYSVSMKTKMTFHVKVFS